MKRERGEEDLGSAPQTEEQDGPSPSKRPKTDAEEAVVERQGSGADAGPGPGPSIGAGGGGVAAGGGVEDDDEVFLPKSSSRAAVKKGAECPYLDTISRQVLLLLACIWLHARGAKWAACTGGDRDRSPLPWLPADTCNRAACTPSCTVYLSPPPPPPAPPRAAAPGGVGG